MSIPLGNDGRSRVRALVAFAMVFTVCASSVGCQSPLTLGGWKPPGLSLVKKPFAALSKPVDYGIDKIQGPTQRILQAADWREPAKDPMQAFDIPPEARAAYDEAERLYQAGEYASAEKAFKSVAKKYKDTPVEEDALFMRAESLFHLKKYSWSQDQYEILLKKYPASRHLDVSTRRLYTIARQWLGFPQKTESGGDIQQVSLEEAASDAARLSEIDDPKHWTVVPNFFDRSRPVFDTNGRALEALKSIWLNDPTGPLADDALMLAASYYLRRNDNLEADRILQIVREEYPNSPHLEEAFLLGSHVKLMTYQGPQYDGRRLEDARRLKESTLRLFPQIDEREMIQEELASIEDQAAARYWTLVKYWKRKRKPQSAAVYCRLILEEFPKSEYAEQARAILAEVQPDSPYVNSPRLLPEGGTGQPGSPSEQYEQEDVTGRVRL